jgi:hypothetical protein
MLNQGEREQGKQSGVASNQSCFQHSRSDYDHAEIPPLAASLHCSVTVCCSLNLLYKPDDRLGSWTELDSIHHSSSALCQILALYLFIFSSCTGASTTLLRLIALTGYPKRPISFSAKPASLVLKTWRFFRYDGSSPKCFTSPRSKMLNYTQESFSRGMCLVSSIFLVLYDAPNAPESMTLLVASARGFDHLIAPSPSAPLCLISGLSLDKKIIVTKCPRSPTL